MNMKTQSGLVVPVRIEIDATKKPFFDFMHGFEQNNTGALIPNSARFCADTDYINCTEFVEMNDALYEKIMSIDSVADANAIAQLCNERGLIFSFFPGTFPFHDDSPVGITVDNDYHGKLIFREISQFKTTLTIYNAIKAALLNPESYELVFDAFNLGEINKMGISFDPLDPETANDKIVIAFCNKLNQFVALTEFQIELYQSQCDSQRQTKIDRDSAISEMINGTGDGEVHYTSIASYARLFTFRYIDKYIVSIKPRQNACEDCISLLCPTMLSAMYEYLLFCPFNNIRYKKCVHKKCNRFFMEDTHHPQKRCEQHMEVFRRKRQNYKK